MNLLKLSPLLSVLLTAPHFCPTTVFATERFSQSQLNSIKDEINRDNSLYQEAFQTACSEGKSASWMELLDLKNVKPDKNADFVYRATLRYHNFVPQSFKTKKSGAKKPNDRYVDVPFDLTHTTESDLNKGLNHIMLWFSKFLSYVEIEVRNNFNNALWYDKSTAILQKAIQWSEVNESADCNGILTKVSVQMFPSESQNKKMLECFENSYKEIKKYAQAS